MYWNNTLNEFSLFLFLQKLDALRDGMLIENESQKDASAVSSSRWNGEFSPTSTTVTESTQAGELISRTKLAAEYSFTPTLPNNIC